jgi:hypothetical protein
MSSCLATVGGYRQTHRLSFDNTRTAQETTRPAILLLLPLGPILNHINQVQILTPYSLNLILILSSRLRSKHSSNFFSSAILKNLSILFSSLHNACYSSLPSYPPRFTAEYTCSVVVLINLDITFLPPVGLRKDPGYSSLLHEHKN